MRKRNPRRTDEEWINLIQECRSSGLSDKCWCEEHHIHTSNFYYQIRRLRNFGFTETKVIRLLKDYRLENHLAETKEWYDGYLFGSANIYCPWDVISYVDHLSADPYAEPEAFWINTSGNDLVKRFIDKADKTTQNEIERLIAGEVVEKTVRLDLTYDELDSSILNLWSVLFTTGYLTQAGR